MLQAAASGRASAHAYTVPERGERSGYRYSARFWAKSLRGMDCIVRLGAAECLGCAEQLRVPRRVKGGVSGRSERVVY
jgi:hypothetical protein